MPAPAVRNSSARSCTRTCHPRCASAQAAVSPANPAPTISARRRFMACTLSRGLAGDVSWLCAYDARQAHDRGKRRYAALQEDCMARLRHFAVVVKDLDKAAAFYEAVFELTRVGREDLDIGSAIYLSDGVINLALLNYKGKEGGAASDRGENSTFVGAHHFGFQVEDLAATEKRIEA